MPAWAIVVLVVLLILLVAPGLLVKSLSFLLYIALALAILWIIVWLVRALAGGRRR